jgi:GcrA cell cycle regulator
MNPSWTVERVDLLKKLWDQGASGVKIAAELGITKSATLGKVHRLKLTPRKPETERRGPSSPKLKPVKPAVGGGITTAAVRKINAAKSAKTATGTKPGSILSGAGLIVPLDKPLEPPRLVDEPLRASMPAILSDLTDSQCRWPLKQQDGFPGRWVMCGAPRDASRDTERALCMFCAGHVRMAYRAQAA